MAYKDLHEEPFDETTIAKLEIFEDYAQAWIPTFVMSNAASISIFDFFAGTGYDKKGTEGSPIRILNKIKEQLSNIFQRRVEINVHFNEWNPQKKNRYKFEILKEACNDYLDKNQDVKRAIKLNLYNEDFEILFPKLLPEIKQNPSLVYLDQNGIKFLSDKYFLELENTRQTDFLYFLSASYFWRFGKSEEFKVHLDIDMDAAKRDPYKFIHRNIIDQIRKRLPQKTELKLYPYTLKKGANIHGIIFGASHPRAVDKFLAIAWKRNEVNGEANFDIDDDKGKLQMSMFEGKRLTKIEKFKQNAKEKLLSGEIDNNFGMLNYAYQEGHIGSHAADCLKEMKRNREIDYTGNSPLVTYENVYKLKRLIHYNK
ncbi:MAG TPA: three-Cys-motif partner protein TcmP [Chitinophagaceae bacterium]|jgi:three-Cys-motif partner protein|nr:three-Cys-motif partner protein TcmP [Chitinophagaceae bacterium]HWC54427.1 three-Cys-motif partner protein TcmP [Chitinophagaceae bacterium]